MTSFWYLKPLGVDIFCTGRKFLVFNLISRNFKIKYRRSILGVFWTLVGPTAQGFVYYFVFKFILKVQIPHYLPFIMSGILSWTFFSQTLGEGMEALIGNIGLFSKVPIPLPVFPLVSALTNLVTLGLAVPVIIGAAIISEIHLGWTTFFLLYFYAMLFFIVYGLSSMLSIAYVHLRDLKHILGIGLQAWLYATPVMYSERMIPARFAWIAWVNPLSSLFAGIHQCLMDQVVPEARCFYIPLVWSLVFLSGAILTHRFLSDELVEQM